MEKISIIVPVYNEELYIRQCIESIINQTYENLEIIIVDDGSVDQSLAICNELRLKDDRILVFSQTNCGVSVARNHGLDAATGEFVFFLDGDDAIHPLLIERLLWMMKKYNTELSMCNCMKVDNDKIVKIMEEKPREKKEYQCLAGDADESREWFHITYSDELSSIGGKMIQRKFIGTIRFEKELGYGEDTLFLYDLVSKGMRITYSDLEWYYYRQHETSATHSASIKMSEKYLECTKIIRDREYNNNNFFFALHWESRLVKKLENSFLLMKQEKDKEVWKKFRKKAVKESKHPLFHFLKLREKLIFWFCFFCQPLYEIEIWGVRGYLWKILNTYKK